MPQAIPIAAAAFANWVGGMMIATYGIGIVSTTTYAVVTGAAYFTASAGLSLALTVGINAAFAPPVPGLPAVQTPLKQPVSARQSGFGEARLSGVYTLFEAKRGVSYDVLAIHDGRIEEITHFYLHDDEVTLTGSDGVLPPDGRKYSYGNGGDRVYFEHRLGLDTETHYSRPAAAFSSLWTSSHRGDGVASIALTCRQSKDKYQAEDFPNGLPMPSVAAKLQRLFDPREPTHDIDDPDTWAWSDNPALALLAYLTYAPGGMGLDYSRRIAPTLEYWTDAADHCDQLVSLAGGGTEKRYRLGGVYTHDSDPTSVIVNIVSTFDGWLAQRGDGALLVFSGHYYEPGVTFTAQHVKSLSVRHFTPDEQAVNEIVVTFTNPATQFQTDDAGAQRNEADIVTRGRVRSQRFDLSWVPSATQAARLGKRKLNRAGQELRGQVRTNLYGLNGLGERYIRLQLPDENAAVADLVVEIEKVEIDLASLSLLFTWIEADPNLDAWDPDTDEVDHVDPPERPPAEPLDAPVIDAVTPLYEPSGSVETGARLQIDVTAPIEEDVEWLARWRLDGQTFWNEGTYSDIDDGAAVTLVTGFVTASGDVEVQAAYRTAAAISPWSATFTVAVAAPSTSFDEAVADAVQVALQAALVAGENITITPASDGTFTISATSEAIEDVVGALLAAGSNVTVTYNDAGDTITISASGGGGGGPGGSWAPLTNGEEPMEFVSDGAGTPVLVAL